MVSKGEPYLTPTVARYTIEAYQQGRGHPSGPLERLSPRQREVLRFMAEGHSTKEIAFRLGLSAKTVETHRAQLMERLDIHDVAGLVKFAMQSGLIPPLV